MGLLPLPHHHISWGHITAWAETEQGELMVQRCSLGPLSPLQPSSSARPAGPHSVLIGSSSSLPPRHPGVYSVRPQHLHAACSGAQPSSAAPSTGVQQRQKGHRPATANEKQWMEQHPGGCALAMRSVTLGLRGQVTCPRSVGPQGPAPFWPAQPQSLAPSSFLPRLCTPVTYKGMGFQADGGRK